MKQFMRFSAALVIASLLGHSHASAQSTDVMQWAVVTDDDSTNFPGCDAVTIVDVTTGKPVLQAKQFVSPGRLALTSDASWIVSPSNNNGAFITLVSRLQGLRPRWNANRIAGPFVQGGPIAISPDDSTLLVPRIGGVQRYLISRLQSAALGAEAGFFDADDVMDLLFTSDSATVIVIRASGTVDFLDAQTLARKSASLPYQPIGLPRVRQLRQTFAAITRDDRYVVINTGTASLNVLDLVNHISSRIAIDALSNTYGVGFNYAAEANLLAVHGHSKVAVYELIDATHLRILGVTSIPSQILDDSVMADRQYARESTIAWTGYGDGIIAAIGAREEYRVFDVHQQQDGVTFDRRLDFDVCTSPFFYESEIDVVTLNNRNRPPTPTPTPSTATPPDPATPEPATATSSPSPTVMPSSTATSTLSPTATATPTPRPAPLYIPLALRERCTPAQRHADVVLVIDASTSMLDVDASGVVKLDAALAAARAFVGLLTLGAGDQAAVVSFNSEAHVLQALTADKAALDAAFTAVTVRSLTCLVCGVEAAAEELASGRRRGGNTAVIVLLTDGRSNPQPASAAEAAAGRAKGAGVTVFTIGLGEDVDGEALAAMAAPTGKYYRAPTGAELTAIYADVAGAIPCPAGAFWGQR